MRRFTVFIALLLTALVSATVAMAAAIRVNLSDQTMHVSSSQGDFDWPISSARSGFSTPRGSYGVQRLEAMHYSHKYHNSPMPHSIFFKGGYAIHGTYATGSLGAPASHGCIRLAPSNAATLYQIVRAEGARITITGSAPASEYRYARNASRHLYAQTRVPRYARTAPRDSYGEDAAPSALGYAPYRQPDTVLQHWWTDPTGQSDW